MSDIKKLGSDYVSQTMSGTGNRIKVDEEGKKSSESIDLSLEGQDVYEDVFGVLERTSDDIKGIDRTNDAIWKPTSKETVIDEDNFGEIMDKTGVDITDEDLDLLYKVIDADGDGVLTAEEYSFMMDGENGITSFSMWRAFSYQDSAFENEVEKNASTIYAGSIDPDKFKNDPAYAEKMKVLLTSEQLQQIEKGERVKVDTEKGLSPEKINDLLEKIINSNGKITIDDYKDFLNESDFKELKALVEDEQSENATNVGIGSKVYNEELPSITIDPEKDKAYTLDDTTTEEQQIMAKYLNEKFSLGLEGDALTEFIKNMPEKADYAGFLRNMAKISGSNLLTKNDVDNWISNNNILNNQNVSTVQGEDGIQSLGVTTDIDMLGVNQSDGQAVAKQEYFTYLTEQLGLPLTQEQFEELIVGDETLQDMLTTMDTSSDGAIIGQEFIDYLKDKGIDISE